MMKDQMWIVLSLVSQILLQVILFLTTFNLLPTGIHNC